MPVRVRKCCVALGITACALLLVAWAASTRVAVKWSNNSGGLMMVDSGVLRIHWTGRLPRIGLSPREWESWTARGGWGLIAPQFGTSYLSRRPYGRFMELPAWMLLVAIGLPTWWMWRRGPRRAGFGYCATCGYDVRGCVSERCSECGKAFKQ